MTNHWRAQAAAAEAAAWREEHKDWAKGLPAEVRGCKVTGKAGTTAPGWDQLPWWRMDNKKVGAPAPRVEASPQMPAKRPSRGCWGELTGTPLPLPEMTTGSLPTPAEVREEKRVLCLPAGQKLNRTTWTADENRTMTAVRNCKSHKNSGDLERLNQMQLTATGHQWWVTQLSHKVNGHRQAAELAWSDVDEETVAAPESQETTDLAEWVRERLAPSQLQELRAATKGRTQRATLLARVMKKQRLATAELEAWVAERLTAKQLEALTADDLSGSTTRVHRHQARAKLQELPGNLRLRR